VNTTIVGEAALDPADAIPPAEAAISTADAIPPGEAALDPADAIPPGEAALDTALVGALRRVYDPCSQAWSRPMSIYDLGLVRAASIDEGGLAHITISLTAPFCMAIATIMQATEQRVGELDGVTGVDVQIDTITPWSAELMTEQGRQWLAQRRRADRSR
jgi:metal-sulfur cluster biosynthetic enzyme